MKPVYPVIHVNYQNNVVSVIVAIDQVNIYIKENII